MSKIELSTVGSQYLSTEAANANFAALEAELQDKVLYRDNPDGEPNQLESDIDVNNHRLLNVPDPVESHEPVTKGFFDTTVGDAAANAAAAAQSAEDAENSANTAAALAADIAEQIEGVSPNIYVFDGDGVETQFTIGVFPPSEDYIKVYVDGERLSPAFFSLLNNVVTIPVAPGAGTDNVLVDVSATVALVLAAAEDWGLITIVPDEEDDYGSIV